MPFLEDATMSEQHKDTMGIQELNAVNEATRFDELLSSYFRIPNASTKRRKSHGARRISSLPALKESNTCPETSLTQLKRLLRDATAPIQSQYIQKLHAMVVYQLKRANKSAMIFTRVVDLCREIFKRSAVFRALIATQTAAFFDQLLVAAGENPSANVSKALRIRSQGSKQVTILLTLIETWKQDFGERYPSLVAGHAVLMERGYVFPNERERLQQEREREVDTQRHRQRVSNAKKQQRDREMRRYVVEMEQVLIEMNRAFEILVPTLDTFRLSDGEERKLTLSTDGNEETHSGERKSDAHNDMSESEKRDDTDDVEWEDVAVTSAAGVEEEEKDVEWENVTTDNACTHESILGYNSDEDDTGSDQMDINDIVQAYGLGSSSYHLTVEISKQVCEESSENDVLFRSLADGALRIRKRFLPLLDDWEQHSTLSEPSASRTSTLRTQREVLQQIRDLRDRMTRVLLKWDDLVQDSKSSKQDAMTQPAVVSLPLDMYNPPTKRKRRRVNEH